MTCSAGKWSGRKETDDADIALYGNLAQKPASVSEAGAWSEAAS